MIDRGRGGKEVSPVEEYEQKEQRDLLEKIERTHERLKEATGQMEIMRLEGELTSMMSRLKQDDSDGMTLDALLQEAQDSRNRRLYGHGGHGSNAKLLLDRFGSGRR